MKNDTDNKQVLLDQKGIQWCFEKELVDTEFLKAKYKKDTRIYICKNQTTSELKNIKTNAANVLIGFLDDETTRWVTEQENNGNMVYGIIANVKGQFPELSVRLKLSKHPIFLAKIAPATKNHNIPRLSNLMPIKPRLNSRAKHPLTNKAFAHRSLDKFIEDNRGISGIYCIYSKEFATYIGQSIDVGARVKKHFYDLKKNKHHNAKMQSDWKDKGERFFTYHLIQTCDENLLDELEEFYIDKAKTYQYGYNCTPDGQGKVVSTDKTSLKDTEKTLEQPIYAPVSDEVPEVEIADIETKTKHGELLPHDNASFRQSGTTIIDNFFDDYDEAEQQVTVEHYDDYVDINNGGKDSSEARYDHKIDCARVINTPPIISTTCINVGRRIDTDLQDNENTEFEKVVLILTDRFKLSLLDRMVLFANKHTSLFSKRSDIIIKQLNALNYSAEIERRRFESRLDTKELKCLLSKIEKYV
ncbi:GIY-YIG nuclease family protein [Thalassotalea sp. PLHSN55]|uniref:GIY-YIG nuclease family protein n=1 Tax=Thalassotalea sp. PLHSN55 TaxID=3435888 RepID=UPI003F87E362